MKLIIAGSRDLIFTTHFIDSIYGNVFIFDDNDGLEIVSGGATGVDSIAKKWAQSFGDEVIYTEFPANWKKHGRAAGPIRNKQMAEYADALLLIWDGESRGSKNMKEEMIKLKKPIYEVIIKETMYEG